MSTSARRGPTHSHLSSHSSQEDSMNLLTGSKVKLTLLHSPTNLNSTLHNEEQNKQLLKLMHVYFDRIWMYAQLLC